MQKNDSSRDDFITGYSTKDCWEDFAESLAGYVAYGHDFRQKATGSQRLRRKYDWLNVNVFGGIEYDTDIPYIRADPDYVFEGELKQMIAGAS